MTNLKVLRDQHC